MNQKLLPLQKQAAKLMEHATAFENAGKKCVAIAGAGAMVFIGAVASSMVFGIPIFLAGGATHLLGGLVLCGSALGLAGLGIGSFAARDYYICAESNRSLAKEKLAIHKIATDTTLEKTARRDRIAKLLSRSRQERANQSELRDRSTACAVTTTIIMNSNHCNSQ